MGFGPKIFSQPGASFLDYVASKFIPGKQKLKTDYIKDEKVLDTVKNWASKHIKREGLPTGYDVTGDFNTYKFAPGDYNVRRKQQGKDTIKAKDVSFKDMAYDPAYGAMNTIGGSKLVKDEHGNVYSYDDYVFGKTRGGQDATTFKDIKGDSLKAKISNMTTAALENTIKPIVGTNEGGTQYEGYIGNNPNAQPVIQSLGSAESLGLNPEHLANIEDVTDFVPDINRYYTEEGKERNLFNRLGYDVKMNRQKKIDSGEWYAGKHASGLLGSLKDLLTKEKSLSPLELRQKEMVESFPRLHEEQFKKMPQHIQDEFNMMDAMKDANTERLGIPKYTGSASQNIALMQMLGGEGGSVVDYLKSQGRGSSIDHRRQLWERLYR